MRILFVIILIVVNCLFTNKSFGQVRDAWIEINLGTNFDFYNPAVNRDILGIQIRDSRSFYSDFEDLNLNNSFGLDFRNYSNYWLHYKTRFGLYQLSASTDLEYYTAKSIHFDAGLGIDLIEFFELPLIDEIHWEIYHYISAQYFESKLKFTFDNTLQGLEKGFIPSFLTGTSFGVNINKNTVLSLQPEYRVFINDKLTGWKNDRPFGFLAICTKITFVVY